MHSSFIVAKQVLDRELFYWQLLSSHVSCVGHCDKKVDFLALFVCLYVSTLSLNVYLFVLQLGVDTVPVLVGPVTYLLLSKPAKGVEKSFSLLSLLPKVLAVYK